MTETTNTAITSPVILRNRTSASVASRLTQLMRNLQDETIVNPHGEREIRFTPRCSYVVPVIWVLWQSGGLYEDTPRGRRQLRDDVRAAGRVSLNGYSLCWRNPDYRGDFVMYIQDDSACA